jgi:hypothetical protein
MEWVDNTSNTILRPASQLSTHVYGMGYWRTQGCHSCWRIDVSDVWQEVVIDSPTTAHIIKICPNSLFIRTLRRGKHRLLLWLGVEADGSMESTTPSKLATPDEMGRLERVRDYTSFKQSVGLTPYYSLWRNTSEEIFRDLIGLIKWHSVKWRKYMRYCVPINRVSRFTNTGNKQTETEKSENLFLYIDMPRFDFPVIFSEPVGCELCRNDNSFSLTFSGNSCCVVFNHHCPSNRSSCRAIDIVYIHYG